MSFSDKDFFFLSTNDKYLAINSNDIAASFSYQRNIFFANLSSESAFFGFQPIEDHYAKIEWTHPKRLSVIYTPTLLACILF